MDAEGLRRDTAVTKAGTYMNHPELHTRRAWFDDPAPDGPDDLREALVRAIGVTCPCCGYPLLNERATYEICPLCWWENDGLDDGAEGRPGDLDRESGPNRTTLREAREHFEEHCVTEVSGGRIIRGMNDAEAIENNRTVVWALDALIDAPDTEAVDGMLILVNRALRENARDLRAGMEGIAARFSDDGYLLTEGDDWPKDLTGVQLRFLSERLDHLPHLKEDGSGLLEKYWDDLSSEWDLDLNSMVRLEKLFRDGELSVEQEDLYRRIKARFEDALPLIDELGLSRPPVPLD